jgi:hypothetical protein
MVTLLLSSAFILLLFALIRSFPEVCGLFVYVLLGPCGGGLVSEEEDDPRVGGQWRIATLSRRGKRSPAAGTMYLCAPANGLTNDLHRTLSPASLPES